MSHLWRELVLLLSGRLPKCSCLKLISSVPTFKLLFCSLPVLLRPDLAGLSQPIPHPSTVAQVLLPMVADLLRANCLSSWTPKNPLHPLLIVKNLPSFPSPVTVTLCSSWNHWLLALAWPWWGIALLLGVACLKLLSVNPPAPELVPPQGEVSSFLLRIN